MFTVIIPVGPSDAEIRRLGYLLDSVRRHERAAEIELILIDDAPIPRLGVEHVSGWGSGNIVRTRLWTGAPPDAHTAMMAGTICGIRRVSPEAEFAVKLDTDALVVGSFSDQVNAAFARDSSLGMLGSYDRTCTGSIRDWSVWVPRLRRAGTRWSLRPRRKATAVRELIAAADANGEYELGAHCLGGAYAVSRSLVRRRDLLRWEPWVGSGIAEDVVMGVLCAAAGLRMRSLTAAGEPFGLAHVGLPASPEWLLAHGHSIVHAVKDPDPTAEARLRQRLQAQRPQVGAEPERVTASRRRSSSARR